MPSTADLGCTVRVWAADVAGLPEVPSVWRTLLDEDERDRLDRRRRPEDRASYAAAHVLARLALAQATGRPAATLAFLRPAGQRPRLAISEAAFSLSHAEGMAAVAICAEGPVGIDVERAGRHGLIDPGIIRLSCSTPEIQQLESLPPAGRAHLFLRLWTAKEAVAKAEGLGLALPFPSIHLADTEDAADVHEEDGSPRRWRLWRSRPSDRHELALAWRGAARVASRTLDATELTRWAYAA